ncbi:uncharacterized protein [Hetaerina americana]|uniref:uncharacterized protein n=1 Tax=Hetaerina americana TaxID=62018 RepID=UPI003A7F2DEB
MSAIICTGGGDEEVEAVSIGLLSPLIAVLFGFLPDSTSSNLLAPHKQALKVVLSSILRKVNEKLLSQPAKNQAVMSQNWNPDEGERNLKPVDIYHLITLRTDIGGPKSQIAVEFLTNQLADLLTFSPDITLNQAFSLQTEWSYCKIPRHLQQMLASMLRPFEAKNALDVMQTILKMGEVNWRNVLACISVFLVTKDESGMLMKDFVSSLVQEAFSDGCRETLILALLTARQCSLENSGFPSYAEWFDSTFGVRSKGADQKGATAGRNFRLLVSLLTDLVPVESVMGLRAHILHPPQAPASAAARTLLSDYLHLARTRLSDFGVRLSDQGGLFRMSQLAACEVNGSNQSLASAEVEYVLSHFEQTGEILRTVLEASVFRKRYLEQTFLPELLKPRILPEEPDTRMKVIKILASKGLISASMIKVYSDQCEEERKKPENRESNLLVELPDCLSSLSNELHRHLQIIESMKSEEVVSSSNQMWGSLKDSLSIVNQSLQKVLTTFALDSKGDMHLDGREKNIFDSGALMENWNSSQDEQVISVFLDAWMKGLTYFPTVEKIQWLQLMLGLIQPSLIFPLYRHLYQLFAKSSLEVNQGKVDLAVSLALCIHAGKLVFPAVSLRINGELSGTQEDNMSEGKVVSILYFLSCVLPVSNKHEMEHSFHLCETFLSGVEDLFPSFEHVKIREEIVSNIPGVLISKYLFLLKRYQHADVNRPVKFIHSLAKNSEIWKDILKKSEVQLKQWLRWELLIDPVSDIFESLASKKDYLLYCLLSFCSDNPPCNVLSVINNTMTAIISAWSSEVNSLGESAPNLLMLLTYQEFLTYKLECVMCSSSGQQDWEMPWLLSFWMDLKREDDVLFEKKENADWVLLRIVSTLPTYLILKNDTKMIDADVVKDTIVILINKYLKESLCDGGFLPFSFMMYLIGGVVDYHSEPEDAINYLIRMCPTFKMALLAHHVLLQPKLQKLKDLPHLKDLHLILKVLAFNCDSDVNIPIALQSADWEVALSLWAKEKAKFPPSRIVTSNEVVKELPLQVCRWLLYFDMLSLGWNELFKGKCVTTSDLSLVAELVLQQPSLAMCLDVHHLEKQSSVGPHDYCPQRGTLSVAHSTCRVLMAILSGTQPEEQIGAWMTLLRAVLSARKQWGVWAKRSHQRMELGLDRDLRSILSHVLKIVTSRNMLLSDLIPPVYLSGLDKIITCGILIP